MPYTPPPFTPSVSIDSTDNISDTDEKLQTITNESVAYVNTETPNIIDDVQTQADALFAQLQSDTNSLITSILTVQPDATYYTKTAIDGFLDAKTNKSEIAYDDNTTSFIPNTLVSGAIIEKGSNANGEYVKFADGTLICTYLNTAGAVSPNAESVFGWTFPHVFFSFPVLFAQFYGNDSDLNNFFTSYLNTSHISPSLTSLTNGFKIKSTSSVQRFCDISFKAIGRWK